MSDLYYELREEISRDMKDFKLFHESNILDKYSDAHEFYKTHLKYRILEKMKKLQELVEENEPNQEAETETEPFQHYHLQTYE